METCEEVKEMVKRSQLVHLSYLYREALKTKRILELGLARGWSTRAMLYGLRDGNKSGKFHLWNIDYGRNSFSGDTTNKIKESKLGKHFTWIHKNAFEVPDSWFKRHKFDLIFIDIAGDKTELIRKCTLSLREGGVLIAAGKNEKTERTCLELEKSGKFSHSKKIYRLRQGLFPLHTMVKGGEKINEAYVVVGMHRTGTSLAMALLSILGVDIGCEDRIGNGDKFNEKGYFENPDFLGFHIKVLHGANGCWYNVEPEEKLNRSYMKLKDEHLELIKKYSKKKWGFKAVRPCLFPILLKTIPNLHLIVTRRHPESVAQSLKRRNDFGIERSKELYAEYYRRLDEFLRRNKYIPRIYIDFDDLIDHTEKTACKIARFLEIDPTKRQLRTIRDFTEGRLRHHKYDEKAIKRKELAETKRLAKERELIEKKKLAEEKLAKEKEIARKKELAKKLAREKRLAKKKEKKKKAKIELPELPKQELNTQPPEKPPLLVSKPKPKPKPPSISFERWLVEIRGVSPQDIGHIGRDQLVNLEREYKEYLKLKG